MQFSVLSVSPCENRRMVMKSILVAIAFVGAGCGTVSAAENSYGTLPLGMRSVSAVSEVPVEISRDHLFDPAAVTGRLPPGYRLITAEEYAKDDPAVAGYLKANPSYARHGVGSLTFMLAGKFTVDGVRVHPSGTTPMAFWWVRAVGPRDARMQGKVEWLQLRSWYSRDLTERSRILATDPMAEFVELQVVQAERNLWRLHLVLDNEVVDAEVRSRGEPTARRATGQQFMSVPMSGAGAGSFWVITYLGHHHQPASGPWRSQGSGVFSAAFQIPHEAEVFGTGFQSRWSALSGLYDSKP